MNDTQPTGLQLAVKLLAQIGDNDSDAAIAAVHDLADEHAQRLTLQHRAADLAQRVAELEVERNDLRARLDACKADAAAAWVRYENANRLQVSLQMERAEMRAKYDELLVALHGIGAALGIPEGDRSPYSVTCGVLERVNRLAVPMSDEQRQAVLLTDEKIERAVDGHGWTVSELQVEDIPGMARDIEAAVLAANNLEVRRG